MKSYFAIMLISSAVTLHAGEKTPLKYALSLENQLASEKNRTLELENRLRELEKQNKARYIQSNQLNQSTIENRLYMLETIANQKSLNENGPAYGKHSQDQIDNKFQAGILFNKFAKLYMERSEEEIKYFTE